ncbi:DUF2520 domain-containing protein [Saccharopolyspora sp. ID03-671]|uniref:Rossmann-like and DUF2520 domain-containing protein n=1 Tax=Saccharopolyspora sp. ID03-671 TaxID=3073066 RepID=UPI0032477015
MAETAEPLDIGLVGAGKAGLVLASALSANGHRIARVWDPSEAGRARARETLGAVHVLDTAEGLGSAVEVLLLAVPDDALADAVASLAEDPRRGEGIAVLHVSGRYGAGVLEPLRAAGAITAAMHPAMTFTGDIVTERRRLEGTRFAITGPSPGLRVATRLVRDVGGVPLVVAEHDRALYHAALAHGSNHLVTLVVQATRVLQAAGVADAEAVLGPPLRAALDNAMQRGVGGATGPVVRGDVGTVAEHLSALGHAAPEVVPAYREMSLAAASLASDAGRLGREDHERLRAALANRT